MAGRRRRRAEARAAEARGTQPGTPLWGDATARGLALALLLLVAIAFAPAVTHPDFFIIDDAAYVLQQPMVAGGLSREGIGWAFGLHGYLANWHPVTWISHMADVSAFGLAAGAHKAVNAAFHLGATLLFFLALRTMTGAPWPSAVAAALFGIHPLRAESVVWVSERKDVLAAFFWMATLLAWARRVRSAERRSPWPELGCFALGLASKSMVVTLPVVLLVLDFWPLARHRERSPGALLREKLPMLALSLLVGIATISTQSRADAIATWERVGLAQRAANAICSLTDYLAAFALPRHLSVYYPHRFPTAASLAEPTVWLSVLASLALIAGLSGVAVALRRRAPAIAVGWLWFCIAIAPVLGLIQVGEQGMADRYSYLPSAGLAIAVAFPLWQLAAASQRGRRAYAVAAGVLVIGMLVPATFAAVLPWRSSTELLRRSLEAVEARGLPHDGFLHRMLAASLLADGSRGEEPGGGLDPARREEALRAAETAARLRPHDYQAHSTFTDALISAGRYEAAVAATDAYLAAARRAARSDFVALAWYTRGVALSRLHDYAQAQACFERALEAAPGFSLAAESLAWAREAAAASARSGQRGPSVGSVEASGETPGGD